MSRAWRENINIMYNNKAFGRKKTWNHANLLISCIFLIAYQSNTLCCIISAIPVRNYVPVSRNINLHKKNHWYIWLAKELKIFVPIRYPPCTLYKARFQHSNTAKSCSVRALPCFGVNVFFLYIINFTSCTKAVLDLGLGSRPQF